jgi:hypothetical protein
MPALNRFRNVGACTQQNSSGYVALRDRSLVHELGRESLRRLAWRCSEHHKRVGCAILSCSRPISRAEGIKEQVKQSALSLDNRKTPWSEVRAVAAIFIATLFGKARTKRPQTTD